jgi:hypothetical protein
MLVIQIGLFIQWFVHLTPPLLACTVCNPIGSLGCGNKRSSRHQSHRFQILVYVPLMLLKLNYRVCVCNVWLQGLIFTPRKECQNCFYKEKARILCICTICIFIMVQLYCLNLNTYMIFIPFDGCFSFGLSSCCCCWIVPRASIVCLLGLVVVLNDDSWLSYDTVRVLFIHHRRCWGWTILSCLFLTPLNSRLPLSALKTAKRLWDQCLCCFCLTHIAS